MILSLLIVCLPLAEFLVDLQLKRVLEIVFVIVLLFDLLAVVQPSGPTDLTLSRLRPRSPLSQADILTENITLHTALIPVCNRLSAVGVLLLR